MRLFNCLLVLFGCFFFVYLFSGLCEGRVLVVGFGCVEVRICWSGYRILI